MYFGFVFALRRERGVAFISRHWFFFHPNAVCVWRVVIGLFGIVLYFLAGQHFWGTLLFTLSATLDGVDGLIARKCDLVTPLGEEIDPLCDKATYLPPMFFFAYMGLLDITIVWALFITELCGQFLVRYIIKRFTRFSVQANNFGKIKAVLCFALIIYCALLNDALKLPDFTTQILYVCIILSIASSAVKLIGNRFYADILSILNLLCGIAGIILVFHGRYVLASIAIMTGQIFDLFDGRMAEKHGGTKFGPWLDDIADMVSFGVCPGLLVMMHGSFKAPALVLGAAYSLAVGFRLWRYLSQDKHDQTLPPGSFNGLPSPAGAMIALGACLFWQNLWITWATVLFVSYLLVGHVRFIHFGRVILRRIPRSLMVIFGFIIVFLIAYLIKTRDPQMLGATLLLFSLFYLLAGNGKVFALWKIQGNRHP
ncbi:MAG: CDP-alcohol phosphatidyltransferase family protein [Deltaproteobacteria bacterium]|nr:CDP-alcohol phosphatidyltransferase family protein [Deltaproteobacteria bacterium]